MKSPAALLLLLLAACGTTYAVPEPGAPVVAGPAPATGGAGRTPAAFARVAARVEPVAEALCREETPGAPAGYCNFVIRLETNPQMPANAFQTRLDDGRPAIIVGAKLLDEMQSDDELAFVLSHEASHHIAAHLAKQQQSQVLGALILGGLVSASAGPEGVSEQALRQAMDVGALVGGRVYSQSFELEADWLGAFIADRAGYDPERGAQIFVRPALAGIGGPPILTTHPPSVRRASLAAQAAAEIRRQRAAGLIPRPAYADRGF